MEESKKGLYVSKNGKVYVSFCISNSPELKQKVITLIELVTGNKVTVSEKFFIDNFTKPTDILVSNPEKNMEILLKNIIKK